MKKGHATSQELIYAWFQSRGWKPFPFQEDVWQAYSDGYSGILNAPTGSGKTYALAMPVIMQWIGQQGEAYLTKEKNGLQFLWITPLRALAKDIHNAITDVVNDLGLPWQVALRTGDTSSAQKQKQKKQMPEVMITTPESLQILLSNKGYAKLFKTLQCVVVDEWHELLGSKRGVLVELALSRIKSLNKHFRIWGISATIANLEEGLEVLLGVNPDRPTKVIKAKFEKRIKIESILPDEMERFPWAGHLGIKLLDKVIPIIHKSQTTLIFTNTRSQAELWYQYIIDTDPDLIGLVGVHHGSLDREVREWVEEALHLGSLKAVVSTSSLDLGVDFRPVETVIQVGSPKGVARFMQRAGRSGHQPEALSHIYFLPTHALELVEASALKRAVKEFVIESRDPVYAAYDVLVQYAVTLAVSDGFEADQIYEEVTSTFCYQALTREEWKWILTFITTGGKSLHQYNEYSKVVWRNGKHVVESKFIAMRHRMGMGVIVGDTDIKIKYVSGGYLGTIEESFISRLKPGDVFWFAGKTLEFERMKGMTALVRKATHQKGAVPSWMGGRMPLSSQLSAILREEYNKAAGKGKKEVELRALEPIFALQRKRSVIPHSGQLLIEAIETKEGHHVFLYPYEGRLVHEVLGALLGYRIGKLTPISFSIAMNDYGLELLSDSPIPIEKAIKADIFTTENLVDDIYHSVNATEMAKRKFRDISTIAGLVFRGYPHKMKKERHLQASSSLLFDVFKEYEPENLLIKQAYQEVFDYQIEEVRLRKALMRIQKQEIIITRPKKPSPFSFPIMVDRLREEISSEKLSDRVKRMQVEFG